MDYLKLKLFDRSICCFRVIPVKVMCVYNVLSQYICRGKIDLPSEDSKPTDNDKQSILLFVFVKICVVFFFLCVLLMCVSVWILLRSI
jgi:hypothetical protein